MKTKLLLMLLVVGLVAGVAQANLLSNPGFEDGGIYYDDARMAGPVEPNFVVDAGIDMITWSDQQVQLDPNVVNYGPGVLTYYWSANPDEGVVFDSNSIETPTVTITKATNNPSVVTLTLEVNDGVDTDRDSMTIDVYDDGCMAARGGLGLGADNPTDIIANCKTDLEDLAAFALSWATVSGGGITEPFPRP